MTLQTARPTTPRTRPEGGVAVHAIQTGRVRVRVNQIRGKGEGTGRLLHTFLDDSWSDWLPIYAWLIEHPEGAVVADTGETSRTAQPRLTPAVASLLPARRAVRCLPR